MPRRIYRKRKSSSSFAKLDAAAKWWIEDDLLNDSNPQTLEQYREIWEMEGPRLIKQFQRRYGRKQFPAAWHYFQSKPETAKIG